MIESIDISNSTIVMKVEELNGLEVILDLEEIEVSGTIKISWDQESTSFSEEKIKEIVEAKILKILDSIVEGGNDL